MGFKKIFALREGWQGWSQAGFPVEAKDVNACFAERRKRAASQPLEAHPA